jgi:hypothetical protein
VVAVETIELVHLLVRNCVENAMSEELGESRDHSWLCGTVSIRETSEVFACIVD